MTTTPAARPRNNGRMRLRRPALVVLSVLVLAGCGGSSSPGNDDDPVIRAPSSPTPSGKALGGRGGAVGASPGASTAATGAAPGKTSAGTTKNGGTAPGAAPAPGRPAPAAAGSTAPGSYTYDSSGTVAAGGTPRPVKGSAKLNVDPAVAGRQHSVLEGDQGRTEQDLVHGSSSTTLARLLLTNPAFTKEFRPPKPVLVAPRPPTVGRSWSWTMTSTDGKTKASVNARITKTEPVTVGGIRVNTVVVESTLTLSGDVTYTAKMRTNYDPQRRLQVKERTQGRGSFSGFAFTTDITSVLRSTQPS